MTINTADFLELDDEEFDINEACEHLRDVKQELAYTLEVNRTLSKLETRIKNYIKTYGVLPEVDGIDVKIMNKEPQLTLKRGKLYQLYAFLQGAGIEQDDLDKFFETKEGQTAISLKVE